MSDKTDLVSTCKFISWKDVLIQILHTNMTLH